MAYYKKRRFNTTNKLGRNFKDPQYLKWHRDVKKRDGYQCQFRGCRCKNKRKLNVHHIKKWADYPLLRFEISNGITLCIEHHKFIWDKEESHAEYFMRRAQANEKNNRSS